MKKDYSRRQFIKDNSLAGVGTILTIGAHSSLFGNIQKQAESVGVNVRLEGGLKHLGGMSLQQLLDHHRSYLVDIYIPNWNRGVDWEYGGFANSVKPGKEPDFERKGMYHQARAIWMFSYLYNHVTGDKRHLDAAVQGRDFVVKHALTDDFRWQSFMDRKGTPQSEPLDHYGDIYMVLGLSELYKATKEEHHLELAINTAKSVMARLLSPTYQHIKAHAEALEPGTRRLPSWQHFLYSLTTLLKVRRDPAVEYIARYCVRVICEDHWRPEYGVLLEMLDDQFRPYKFDASNWGDFKPMGVSGWHSIQACWMVMDEALRVQHYPTYRQGVEMGISTLDKCYLTGKGIPINETGITLNHPKAGLNKDGKFPWGTLDDVLMYCMIVLEHSHDPLVIKYYNDCFSLHNSKPENIVTNGLLHTPRRFFHTIEILERMISRDGKVSGLLG